MADEHPGGFQKPMKNSLLSAAATGFTFEDSAALLVPVSLQDEPDVELVTSEIDLNTEDQEEELCQLSSPAAETISVNTNTVPLKADVDSSLISLFSKSALEDNESDPFSLMISGSSNTRPPPMVSEGIRESKSSDTLFSLSSLWSSGRVSAPTAQRVSPAPITNQNQGFSLSGYLSGGNATNPVTVGQPVPLLGSTESVPESLPRESLYVTSNSISSFSSPNLLAHAHEGIEGPGVQSHPLPNPNSSHPPIAPPGGAPKGNNFRLGSQKLAYAQYPGLMGTNSSPVPSLSSVPLLPGNGSSQSNPVNPVNTFVPTSSPVFTQYDGLLSKMSHQYSYQPSFGSPVSVAAARPIYSPVICHWFYRKDIDGRPMWKPFSTMDSNALEDALTNKIEGYVATDGGRYDVDLTKRHKMPIYWDEGPSEVRRCSWFYKGPMDSRFIPYDEELSQRLESEYQQAMTTGVWHKRIEFPDNEAIVLHNPNAMAHFCQEAAQDEWGNLPESQLRPRVVKRGVEEFEIEDGESKQIDHLVFLVHGIGAICDFKFRTIVEAVDDFRHLSVKLMQSHFKESVDMQRAGRIEFLPVSWHKALHGDGGIDQKLKPITLKSIPKLRNFTNDTLLDILFYTSPVYAQTIVDTVGNELNRLFNLFLTRNPAFNGYVALSGHSLGSLILFDLLAHQPKIGRQGKASSSEPETSEISYDKLNENERNASIVSSDANESMMVSYTVGSGTGQPVISYPILEFEPTAFFALGSPIAMFVTVRGIDKLGEDFHFPTCPAFFNIFHPYDPVAYRIETLIEPNSDLRPVLIPHHKGRKRFHLELKETMQRVSSDIKQKFLDSLKTTWNTVYQLATFSKGENFEQEMDRVIEGELVKKSEETASNTSGGEDMDQDVGLGKLNGGRRIDYVLQEAPLESFNEYLFALSSHVCYWESEDTMLMIMREIYASMGIFAVTQQISNTTVTSPNLNANVTKNIYSPTYQPQTFPNTNYPNVGVSGFVSTFPSETVSSFQQMSSGFPPPSQPLPPVQVFSNLASVTPTAPPLLLTPNVSDANLTWTNPPLGAPTMTSETGKLIIGARPVVSPESFASLCGMDPTAPIGVSTSVGPPPLTGFVRKP